MIAMNMNKRPLPANSIRRTARWLWPAAVLALVPKCILCVFAYAGLSAVLGFSGPEICGASDSGIPCTVWVFASSLAVVGISFFTCRLGRSVN